MVEKKFDCPSCEIPVVYEKDDVKSHPHCPKCGRNWCPNIGLVWHGTVELKETKNRRGIYYHCDVCHWYSGIDKESEESVVTQTILIDALKECLRKFQNVIQLNRLAFRSTLAGEEPWFTLDERLKKYGKVRTSDLQLIYGDVPITKFELKGWKNYDTSLFYFTQRAHVNIDEVNDAAESEGYICFVTLKDKSVICTRSKDIKIEWEKRRIEIPLGTEEIVKQLVLNEFKRGSLVVKAPDKQGNYRYVLSREYKKRYCKYLRDFSEEILAKIVREKGAQRT